MTTKVFRPAITKLFNSDGAKFFDVTRTDGSAFSLLSLDIGNGGVVYDDEGVLADAVRFTGSKDGQVLYSQEVRLQKQMTATTLNFMNVDKINIEVIGGNYTDGTGWYALDNLAFA
jgi:hypothetical protein